MLVICRYSGTSLIRADSTGAYWLEARQQWHENPPPSRSALCARRRPLLAAAAQPGYECVSRAYANERLQRVAECCHAGALPGPPLRDGSRTQAPCGRTQKGAQETGGLETAPTQFVEVGGIRFAYRSVGKSSGTPLTFLQHFSGHMDSWDPAGCERPGAQSPRYSLRQRRSRQVHRTDTRQCRADGDRCKGIPGGPENGEG
jgi:hypothetical protein